MSEKFLVVDENDNRYGTYSKLEYAMENAKVDAEDYGKDMFVYKVTTELIDCIICK